jgi:lysophospholipase L1-like esterase
MDTSKMKLATILFLMLVLAVSGYKAYQYNSPSLVIQVNGDPYHTQHYAEANINILDKKGKKVVLFGDSIIYGWKFPNTINGYMLVNRGINGETTDALIGRFTKDVIQIKPQYVVILAGINDAATIYEADPNGVDLQIQKIVSNIRLMAENAKEKGIAPIVCSVLPVNDKYRLPVQDFNEIVIRLNKELESMTKVEGMIYVNFWSIVVDQNTGMLKSDYSKDGIHPSEQAYQQMWNLLVPRLK